MRSHALKGEDSWERLQKSIRKNVGEKEKFDILIFGVGKGVIWIFILGV